MMSLSATVGVGVNALTRNRLRLALTVLGIVIGVAAVIATLAIGQGARRAVQQQIRAMGANVLMVIPGTQTSRGAHMGMGANTTLTFDDAMAIQRECEAVNQVAPTVRSGGQVVYGNQNWATSVQGVTAAFADVRQWPTEAGVFITDSDVRGAAKVCVLGQTVAKQLFGEGNPVGAIVRIREIPFRVVGVMAYKGSSGWGDQDDVVFAPLTTVQRKMLGITHIHSIVLSADDEGRVSDAHEQITDLLRQRHRIRPGGDQDFFIRTQLEVASTAEQTSKVMTMLLASVAAVSLLVGGIGIMNIMLVSVTERTREIGIRRAIGARRADILLQFLVESALLSLGGGALGVGLGIGAATVITQVARWPTVIEAEAVMVAFGFAAAIGLFFGWYPALRASRLDPVEALRYE
jgi:putative ABC transport system permease protein